MHPPAFRSKMCADKWVLSRPLSSSSTCNMLMELRDDIVFEQLRRSPRKLPKLNIKRKPESIFDYEFEDFEVQDYDPYPGIRAPIAI